jgi:hypothetical protein
LFASLNESDKFKRFRLYEIHMERTVFDLSADLRKKAEELRREHLENQSRLKYPRIHVDNSGIAFFDVNRTAKHVVDVSGITGGTVLDACEGELYNFLVPEDSTRYFRIGDYGGQLSTVSFTRPCVVFAAFTSNDDGGIGSSGVYHAELGGYAYKNFQSEFFYRRLSKLISTIRTGKDEVVVKAAGFCETGDDLKTTANAFEAYFASLDVGIERRNFLLGGSGNRLRITEFHPKTGKLVTYLHNSEKRTVL